MRDATRLPKRARWYFWKIWIKKAGLHKTVFYNALKLIPIQDYGETPALGFFKWNAEKAVVPLCFD